MYDYLTINFSGGTYMNVTNLKENYQNLLSFMAEKGYKESTIHGYRHQIVAQQTKVPISRTKTSN